MDFPGMAEQEPDDYMNRAYKDPFTRIQRHQSRAAAEMLVKLGELNNHERTLVGSLKAKEIRVILNFRNGLT